MSDYKKGIPCEQISTTAWEYLLVVSSNSSLRSASRPVHQPSPALPSVRQYTAVELTRAPRRFFAPCNFRTTHGIIGRCVWAEARLRDPLARQEGNRNTWKREDTSSAQSSRLFLCEISSFVTNPDLNRNQRAAKGQTNRSILEY